MRSCGGEILPDGARPDDQTRRGNSRKRPRVLEAPTCLEFISSLFLFKTKPYIIVLIIVFQSAMLLSTIQLRALNHSRATSCGGGSLIALKNSVTRAPFRCSLGEYDCVSKTGVSSAGSFPFFPLAQPFGPVSGRKGISDIRIWISIAGLGREFSCGDTGLAKLKWLLSVYRM